MSSLRSRARRPGAVCTLVLAVLTLARPGWATTLVPMPVEDLTRSSIATVIATVDDVATADGNDGRAYTLVRLRVEETLHGSVPAPVVTLKESGGATDERREVVFGVPRYVTGERVLVFLGVRRDGSLRTNHLVLGKFGLETDRAGRTEAVQSFGAGTGFLIPPGRTAPKERQPLAELRAGIARGARARSVVPPGPAPLAAPPEAARARTVEQVSAPFAFLGGRFFEADEGQALPFLIDQAGDLTLGLAASRQAVNDALAEWNGVAAASLTLLDGGLTADLTDACPNDHKFIFDDPFDEIPQPVGCAGVLGIGGLCFTPFETKDVGGITFGRGLAARVTLADGWGGCPVWNQCNVAEVSAHEIGHAVGLAHSSEDPTEPDPDLANALMYFMAHADGRCADARVDDEAGLGALYPLAQPVTITTGAALPDASFGQPYSVTLGATGGTGGYTWSLVAGGFPGLDLSAGGVLSGTPFAFGSTFFQIAATDAAGDSHVKLFTLQAPDLSRRIGCQRAIAQLTTKFVKAKAKALQKCHEGLLKNKIGPDPGPGGGARLAFCLADSKTAGKIAKAQAKITSKIGGKCGGFDKSCGTGDPGEDTPANLGFGATCPDIESSGCTQPIDDCNDIGACVACIGEAAVDRAQVLYYDALADVDPATDKSLHKCQLTIGKETGKFLLAKDKILAKCRAARLKGKHAAECPDLGADPATAKDAVKAALKIAKAESKKITKICKACGGLDQLCDETVAAVSPGVTPPAGSAGGDDLAPAAIGFAGSCPAVTVPAGADHPAVACGGAVSTLADLIFCVDCVTEFVVDCVDAARTPALVPYPAECNP